MNDRVCTLNTCTCDNGGTEATGGACTSNGALLCVACTGDFYLADDDTCDAWASSCSAGLTETQAPDNGQDRVCTAGDTPTFYAIDPAAQGLFPQRTITVTFRLGNAVAFAWASGLGLNAGGDEAKARVRRTR